jgi:hypothetical protein
VPNIDNIIGGGSAIAAGPRAAAAWARIQDKPTSITIKRQNTTLSAQTVRVEFSSTVREVQGSTGMSSRRDAIIFGIRDHDKLDDTDIQRGDQFALSSGLYRVVDVILTLGEVQARAEVYG